MEYCSAIGRKSCRLWQHRWIWRALCYVKEAMEKKTFFGRICRVFCMCIWSYHLQRQPNFFLSDMDAFYFLARLLWLECPILCWLGVKNGDSYLIPDLREKAFNLSPMSMMLAVGLSYMDFIRLRYVPSIPLLFRFFKL